MSELSQKCLPLEKRFALIVRHNKYLMCRNILVEEELEAYKGLEAKYADLKWEFEKFKEENKKPPVPQKKKHKIAIQILRERKLYHEYLNRTRG